MELITNLYSINDKYTKEEYLLAILNEIKEANELSEKFNSRLIISLNKKDTIKNYEEILKIL